MSKSKLPQGDIVVSNTVMIVILQEHCRNQSLISEYMIVVSEYVIFPSRITEKG